MSQLPEIGAKVNPVDLPRPKTYVIEGWGSMGDAKRLKVIREVALRRGRDPRIATLVIQIIREAGCKPREYEKQAAALLKRGTKKRFLRMRMPKVNNRQFLQANNTQR